ncbi:hypothetical protein CLV63_10555 [Murinocardiopsis flavida]|uniref:Uncharacterized protein n=1 Tax=Murinocardiopsis flavida TaxID=645275 RepID=A0A2P8DME2_9ACTN|nr:hypothetical protein [Murinocardiopsis flavida]PSK98383.1 hypothetical protein CLV63_10555 [Murinocardiopsis flavida]
MGPRATRVLAAVLVSVMVTLCAPVLPSLGLAGIAAAPPPAPAAHTAEPGSHAFVVPTQDSASISKALAKWGGDQRPATRDLPDGHTPEHVRLPGVGAPWARSAPALAVDAPPTADDSDLPLGRAPPRAV